MAELTSKTEPAAGRGGLGIVHTANKLIMASRVMEVLTAIVRVISGIYKSEEVRVCSHYTHALLFAARN